MDCRADLSSCVKPQNGRGRFVSNCQGLELGKDCKGLEFCYRTFQHQPQAFAANRPRIATRRLCHDSWGQSIQAVLPRWKCCSSVFFRDPAQNSRRAFSGMCRSDIFKFGVSGSRFDATPRQDPANPGRFSAFHRQWVGDADR